MLPVSGINKPAVKSATSSLQGETIGVHGVVVVWWWFKGGRGHPIEGHSEIGSGAIRSAAFLASDRTLNRVRGPPSFRMLAQSLR